MSEAQAGTAADSGNDQLIALVLSFFIPGVGQFYQGRTKEGAAFLGAVVLVFILNIVIGIITLGLGLLLTGPLGLLVWAVSLYDTYTQWLDL